jgi:hypothetical protein
LLGPALYRAGRFEAAAHSLDEALKLCKEKGRATDWLFLALAHHRLGHADQARHWLNKASQWFEHAQQGKLPEASTSSLSWEDRLRFQLLRAEVETLGFQ